MIVKVEPYQATLDAIQKRMDEMGKGNQMDKVLKKAINEVSKETKSRIYESTKELYTIKSSQFRKADIKQTSMNAKNGGTVLTVRGATIPIRKGYRNRKNTQKKGARAMIRMAGGALKEMELKANGRSYKAFVATMKSGHEGIFQRVPGEKMKNKRREAIKELVSLSKSKAAEKAYDEKVRTDMDNEISFRLLKHMHAVIGA